MNYFYLKQETNVKHLHIIPSITELFGRLKEKKLGLGERSLKSI